MKTLLVATLLFTPSILAAKTCYDSISETTPSARFLLNSDGTVSDSVTGLMWQTCSYGQSYDADTKSCTNSAIKTTWQEALRASVNDRTGNYDDWQVPNIKELASILEHQCVTPSINEDIFIGSQNDNYWSSTSGVADPSFAWVYTFDRGLNSLHAKASNVYLRFVRYEE